MDNIVALLIGLLVFALIWFIIERFILPMIGDSTITLIIRLVVAVLLILWLLSFLYPGHLWSGRLG